MTDWTQSPLYALILGLLCGVVGFRIGWRSGSRWLLPLVQTALGAVAFYGTWRAGGVVTGAVAVCGWTLGGTLVALPAFRRDPARAEALVLRERPYRRGMVAWLRSGRAFEPRRTVVAHARELALYGLAALFTANLLGLAMGAVLLNTMNAWVARLAWAAREPRVVWLLGWNVWSVIRVLAYVALGAAAAAPVLDAVGLPADSDRTLAVGLVGILGVSLDVVLKLVLSGTAGRRLAEAVHLDQVALELSEAHVEWTEATDSAR